MIDNYKDFKLFLQNLNTRPKILLHACCAPCSTHVIKLLSNYFDITIFYSNDNIYPKSEYDKRLDEIIRFTSDISDSIKVIYDEYNDKDYYDAINGHELDGERSIRCYKCYNLRMEKTAKKAKELDYEYFSTTLSISPHKNSDWINEIGYKLEEKYNVKYLYSNFKKEEGYKESIEMSKEYNLYRQDYCGCEYSLKERKANDCVKEGN